MIKKTLYFSNPAYLSLKDKQMLIRIPEIEQSKIELLKTQSRRTIPIEDIGVVILENRQITITQGLLTAMLDNNVAVITCNEKCMPKGLLLPLEGNTIYNERFRSQLDASQPLQKQLWQQTMVAKIRNQAELLKRVTNKPVTNMVKWANSIKSGDPDNIEARAAVYYWKNIFVNKPDFIRHQEGNYPNMLLNYGYAILRAVVARALVSSGLLPLPGIHHHNRYNAYCLADDIMEPYRPFVDKVVIDMMGKYDDTQNLTKEMKVDLLSIPTLDVVITGKRSPLMIAVSTTTSSLVKCFSGVLRKISYPVFPDATI